MNQCLGFPAYPGEWWGHAKSRYTKAERQTIARWIATPEGWRALRGQPEPGPIVVYRQPPPTYARCLTCGAPNQLVNAPCRYCGASL